MPLADQGRAGEQSPAFYSLLMNAIEYALISDLAQREGGLRQMLDELVRAGALEAHYDMQGTKRYAVPKEEPCES